MTNSQADLEELRRRLDEIDDQMHDLLVERMGVVARVADAKKGEKLAPLQPAREAEILRRLAARHSGKFPVPTLVRMWREMLAATTGRQGHFAVAVYAPADADGFWDLARDQYGSHTPMVAYGSVGQVIRAVTEGQATVGVLPVPQEGDADPWWRYLVSADESSPRIVSRLPFAGRGNARSNGADALSIGHGLHRATGHDRTLLAIETGPDISRARLFRALTAADLPCTFFASWDHPGTVLNLVEIDGFIDTRDLRLDRFRNQLGETVHRINGLGGYAMPLQVSGAAPRQGTGQPQVAQRA